MEIKILNKKLNKQSFQPATPGSAAFDLRYLSDTPLTLDPKETFLVDCGFAIYIKDKSMAGIITPRSSLGRKGIVLSNTIGLIDSDYQGTILVSLHNNSENSYTFEPNERIAQLFFVSLPSYQVDFVEDFTETTQRGVGGFGFTGK